MQSPVVGAGRTAQDLNTLAIQTWGLSAPEPVSRLFLLETDSLNPIFSTEGAPVAKIRVGELGGQSYSPFYVHLVLQS